MDGIDAMGYVDATPVQEAVIPSIIAGKDIIAAAQTGTGKTAAFLLPVLHNILTHTKDDGNIKCMIIVPTRELATQIAQTLEGISYFTEVSSIAVYGGGSGNLFAAERKALSSGVDIVICTPGRMIAHLNMNYVKLDELKYLVLDEADRMLDMGFFDDITKILSYMPKKRKNLISGSNSGYTSIGKKSSSQKPGIICVVKNRHTIIKRSGGISIIVRNVTLQSSTPLT
jgi:superfamily II DNA/RNA helicase